MVPAIWKRISVLWVIVLAACTIQLVPSYDQALVEGLDKANTETLTLFAALETGSPRDKFSDYEERYAALIGQFESLKQRAENRQIPPMGARLVGIRVVRDLCGSDNNGQACLNVSPASLSVVLSGLRAMRNKHRSDGLDAETVGLFRTEYMTAIQQAITVENALRR